jgi:hypothetical protein
MQRGWTKPSSRTAVAIIRIEKYRSSADDDALVALEQHVGEGENNAHRFL